MNIFRPEGGRAVPAGQKPSRFLIGVLQGEGIGPEVIAASTTVLHAIQEKFQFQIEIELGGAIGLEAKARHAAELCEPVIEFCADIFAFGGAILSGPGGGRYVYDLRKRFQLFYKVNPIRAFPELVAASRLKAKPGPSPDIVLVRENLEGLYQGETTIGAGLHSGTVSQLFSNSDFKVKRLLEVAAATASSRSGRVTVIVKRGGLPAISELWSRCAETLASATGVTFEMMDIDFAAYQILNAPELFDVVAAPNCFGDILADIGGLLFASRGLTYGASYSETKHAVYQTNHGCAYDLSGTDRANPVGQIFSLAMLLRESFLLGDAADAIETAVRSTWAEGWRTDDLMAPGCTRLGTRAMADEIAKNIFSRKE